MYVYVDDKILPASHAAKFLNIGISGLRHRIRAGKVRKATQQDYYSQLLTNDNGSVS